MVRLDRQKKVWLVDGGSDRLLIEVSCGLIGPSTWLGWGGFSWRNVLSLVPGIRDDPSVRDFLAGGREEGRPIMAPGSGLTGIWYVDLYFYLCSYPHKC